MLASFRTIRKAPEFRVGGSLHQHPFFVPPEESPRELSGRRAASAAPTAV